MEAQQERNAPKHAHQQRHWTPDRNRIKEASHKQLKSNKPKNKNKKYRDRTQQRANKTTATLARHAGLPSQLVPAQHNKLETKQPKPLSDEDLQLFCQNYVQTFFCEINDNQKLATLQVFC